MRRRRFLVASGALLTAPLTKAQQPSRQFRVGVLQFPSEIVTKRTDEAFLAGLRDRGYAPGKNLVVDFRHADGDRSRLAAMADELIAFKPDVLAGTEVTSTAMKARTSTIPIVLLISADPVDGGLVNAMRQSLST